MSYKPKGDAEVYHFSACDWLNFYPQICWSHAAYILLGETKGNKLTTKIL